MPTIRVIFVFTIGLLVLLAVMGLGIFLIVLLIRVLLKYLHSGEIREEKAVVKASLGEVLRKYRTERNMTQEFVAESIGVSRQAVSKWEKGVSDPSTSNLLALAKLYSVSAEELLKQVE